MTLRLHSTLTGHKDVFVPRTDGRVTMFVCGPTVYARSHIGHGKTYTQFDFVARYFTYLGYRVTYAQNITDIDDKIITKAAEEGREPHQLTEQYENEYMSDMAALHNTNVDIYARAHDHIDQIVSQIETLIDRGHAYQLDDGWYFDLSTFSDYGKLSGRRETHAEDSVARIDEHDNKRNPGDFALWKMRKDGEPYWDTTLGPGRPGWHIEDTAITETLFGPQYDLHGGAVDLIFPHHEAEIAQMEAASGLAPLVRYWVHGGLVRVDGAKMAKSAGNFLTIRDALELTDFRTLRYAFLSQHYRSSLEFGNITIDNARNARGRVENFARRADVAAEESVENIALTKTARIDFFDRLDDDLDTPGALRVLFDYIREHNRRGEPVGKVAKTFLEDINTLFDAFNLGTVLADAEVETLLLRRRMLREEKKFDQANQIRAELAGKGVEVEDTSDGTRWWVKK